jgi:hypothetical protein
MRGLQSSLLLLGAGSSCVLAAGGCGGSGGITRPELLLDTYEFVMAWGDSGRGDGWFARPADVAVDAGGNAHVADRDDHRIQEFAPRP